MTSTLNKPIKSRIIIEELLDFWIKLQLGGDTPREDHPFPSANSKVKWKDGDQGLKMLIGNLHLHGNQQTIMHQLHKKGEKVPKN